MDNQQDNIKKLNLQFFQNGHAIAIKNISDFNSHQPLFTGMQELYSNLSSLTQEFAQHSIKNNKPIACKKGCKWCCYQPVYLTTNEMLLIKEYLKQTFISSDISKILVKAKTKLKITKELEESDKQKISHPCPMLFEGACSIYPVRPMACRVYLSSDEQSCKHKFNKPTDKKVHPELYDFMLRAGRFMNEGFIGYIKASGKKVEEKTIEEYVVESLKKDDFNQTWIE